MGPIKGHYYREERIEEMVEGVLEQVERNTLENIISNLADNIPAKQITQPKKKVDIRQFFPTKELMEVNMMNKQLEGELKDAWRQKERMDRLDRRDKQQATFWARWMILESI